MYVDIQEKVINVKSDCGQYKIIEEEPHSFVICSRVGDTLSYETFTHNAFDALLWIKEQESKSMKRMMAQAERMAAQADMMAGRYDGRYGGKQ